MNKNWNRQFICGKLISVPLSVNKLQSIYLVINIFNEICFFFFFHFYFLHFIFTLKFWNSVANIGFRFGLVRFVVICIFFFNFKMGWVLLFSSKIPVMFHITITIKLDWSIVILSHMFLIEKWSRKKKPIWAKFWFNFYSEVPSKNRTTFVTNHHMLSIFSARSIPNEAEFNELYYIHTQKKKKKSFTVPHTCPKTRHQSCVDMCIQYIQHLITF